MAGSRHTLGSRCPLARTLYRRRRVSRLGLLRVDPFTHDAERVLTREAERAHEIRNCAVHIAASLGAQPATEGVGAGERCFDSGVESGSEKFLRSRTGTRHRILDCRCEGGKSHSREYIGHW